MWHPAALYLAVLFSTTLADDKLCNSDGPGNCTFVSGLQSCSWTFESIDWSHDRFSAVFGTTSSSGANVTSRTACSTGRDEHCLQVRYMLEGNNIGLRVLLIRLRDEDNGDDGGEQLGDDSRELAAWNGTDEGIGVWHNARIPIQSTGYFAITVEARKFAQVVGKTFNNYIYYIKAPCSGIETSTVPSPVTKTQEEITTRIGSHVSTYTSNNVGVVVVVVGAVIVIVVALVVFVLYRQQRLHLWRTCFRNSKRTDTALTRSTQNTEKVVGTDGTTCSTGAKATSGNGNESLYLTPITHEYRNTTSDPYYVNQHVDQTPTSQEDTGTPTGSNTTPRDTNYVNIQLYTTPGTRSRDNDYSVLGNTAGSDAALPHNPYANQTMRADNQNSRESVGRSSDDPYEIV